MKFKSIDELKKHVLKSVFDAMNNEVLDTVVEAEQEAIEDVVYGAGEPKIYQRRRTDGGLQDPSMMFPVTQQSGNRVTMTVYNMAPYNGRSDFLDKPVSDGLAETIEFGIEDNYDAGSGWWSQPRPFTESAVSDLQGSGAHISALQVGLNRRGIQTK